MATLSFKLAEQSHTQTSVTVNVTNIKTDAKFKIAYSYYRIGYEAKAVTWKTKTLSKGVTSDSATLLRMLPGHDYVITVKITCNGKSLSKFIDVSTNVMPGVFGLGNIHSSTVTATLETNVYHYFDVEYRFFYRKKGNKTWLKQRYINVPMGESLTESVLYTGLKENTEYEFLCDAYRNLDGKYSYIRSFEASCTTAQYSPLEPVDVGFDRILVVPNTHKGYIQASPVPKDCTLYLRKGVSPNWTYQRMTSLFKEIYVPDHYALRANRGNSEWLSTVKNVEEQPLNLPTYVQGDPVNVAAADVLKMAKALIDAYEFVSVIENDTSCKEYCERLKEKTSEIEQGGIIKGGDKSVLDLIGEMASAILGDFDYDIGDKDTPLSADTMNDLCDLVLEALASI